MRNIRKRIIEKLTYMSGPGVALVFGSVLCLFVMVICIGAGAAWSSELTGSTKRHVSKFSPVRGDPCLPLLTAARDESSYPALDRNQRSAGKAAVLGLVLGARYALPPAAQTETVSSPRSGTVSAQAVAAWRECKKQQALGKFRWKR